MKANQNNFKTKTAAREYLIAKGWTFSHTSIGDDVFKHAGLPRQTRLISQLRTGRWNIAA